MTSPARGRKEARPMFNLIRELKKRYREWQYQRIWRKFLRGEYIKEVNP